MSLIDVPCSICGTVYIRTLKQVNQAIKRKGEWSCLRCMAGHNRLNLVGQRFGRLVILKDAGTKQDPMGNKRSMWNCQCDCGNVVVTSGNCLTGGHTRSCGCLAIDIRTTRAITHGKTDTREYRIWCAMRTRCTNLNTPGWANYGGRGIEVCERWQSFENFLADMGPCPTGFSIEREDNDGNYEPSNCVWADRTTQSRNTRKNRRIEFNGVTKILKDWAHDLGIDQASLRQRLDKWPLAEAITTPKKGSQHGIA